MQLQPNFKNCFILVVLLFFLYLAYLLYFGDAASSKILLPTDFSIDLRSLINYCVLSVELAGLAIVKINSEQSLWKRVKYKNDVGTEEFVTRADIISHQIITESLGRAPGLTLISEEKASLSDDVIEKYRENNYLTWQRYKDIVDGLPSERVSLSDVTVWIDPLDATQEFTEGLLGFVSVMICISVKGKAKFGVIHRPFANETVWGLVGHGIYPPSYSQNTVSNEKSSNVVLISRSHLGADPKILSRRLSERLGSVSLEPAGGAGYKALRVLNGTAQVYWHARAIKKWDICAPDAILRAAGGHVTDLNGLDLQYDLQYDTRGQDKKRRRSTVNHNNKATPEHVVTDGLLATLNVDHFNLLSQLKHLTDYRSTT